MARATKVWEVPANGGEPQKLSEGFISSETTLEDWIEKHPELIEPDLLVVARQLETGSGPLDLLCLDKGGRLVVVELKRGDAYRDALAQALDYTARIALMSYDEFEQVVDANREGRGLPGKLVSLLKARIPETAEEWTPEGAEPRIVLAGAGADASLRRMVDYLSDRYSVPVNGVFFDVSRTIQGGTLLVRSTVLSDESAAQQGRRRGRGGLSFEELLAIADGYGTRALVTPVLEAWEAATGRRGRPERATQYWSLAKRSRGTSVAAYVIPYDREDPSKKAWCSVVLSALAEDLEMTEEEVRSSISAAGVVLEDDEWIDISTQELASKVAGWMRKAYSKAPES